MELKHKTAKERRYCNYGKYEIFVSGEACEARIAVGYTPAGTVAEHVKISFKKSGKLYNFSDFARIERGYVKLHNAANYIMKMELTDGPAEFSSAEITITLSKHGVEITTDGEEKGYTAVFTGEFIFGTGDSVSAVCLDRIGNDVRSALGPATSKIDDALFDRESDRALRIASLGERRIRYDFEKQRYVFEAKESLRIWAEERVLETRFAIPYKPINKKNTFPTPPAGWMTWYAVAWDSSEQVVLENTQKLKELFGEYGANSVWVDWEWCHTTFWNAEANPEIHFFSPDKNRYPNGLGSVAEKIKEAGFTPALWIGPTNEPAKTNIIEENPDLIYADLLTWCGKYFYDLTSEKYLKEFLPKAFKQVKEWGFEAVKWDCLPSTLEYADLFHENLSDPSFSSEDALHRVIQTGRDCLGEDFYMMSCSGEWDREVLFAMDIFDGGRINADIHGWEGFVENFVERIPRFYPMHNNTFYCDPDNLIVRPEHNTYEQAVTRATFYSLLGMPITIGDDLCDLPEDRADIIRRALPPLDIRPMDLRETEFADSKAVTNLHICKPFGEWNVVQVSNLLEEAKTVDVDFDTELHLEDGEYLVYDYWNHKFLGTYTDEITLSLPASGTVVLAFHKKNGKRQILSTSRHISQGGFDLVDVYEDETGVIGGCSKVVANEPYVITYYNPNTETTTEKTILSDVTGEIEWSV